jgi:energy-converting hydrogenase A subunit R
MPFVGFDLEGPLSPNDNAYELMGLFPGGDGVFEAISRYDDLLTLEGREGYEPGDTLSLILPFLLRHGIGRRHIEALAEKAGLVEGAAEAVSRLHSLGWGVGLITTTYQPYAYALARRIGIPPEKVAATPFPPEADTALPPGVEEAVARAEAEIAPLRPETDDTLIKQRLDNLYWELLPTTPLALLMETVKPVGGWRKVAALRSLSPMSPSEVAVVGDSITDCRMLETVDREGGLAVAFNANQYALPYATCGLASTHISDIIPLLEAWRQGGREAARQWVSMHEGTGHRDHLRWLADGGWEDALPVHRQLRRLVRSRAAMLG